MSVFQIFVSSFLLVNLVVFFLALNQSRVKQNAFGLTRLLTPLGSFVWGDAVIFSIFWMAASIVVFFLNSSTLFALIFSVFWAVRGLGESIYWFNQQFSAIIRNPPKTLLGYSLFKNDSIWFVYQICWQCVMVISIIASIYFAHLWLRTI
ncbi:MAG TPA: hypothetical protein VFG51_00760 [Candidatus Saccharimonadia bacterium]|nr:hypothetical protein [Candidatus Saccharimonadia bacterium]